MQKNIESKVRIYIYVLDEINNIYFRTKSSNLDRNLDRYLRVLDTDGRVFNSAENFKLIRFIVYIWSIKFLQISAYSRTGLAIWRAFKV